MASPNACGALSRIESVDMARSLVSDLPPEPERRHQTQGSRWLRKYVVKEAAPTITGSLRSYRGVSSSSSSSSSRVSTHHPTPSLPVHPPLKPPCHHSRTAQLGYPKTTAPTNAVTRDCPASTRASRLLHLPLARYPCSTSPLSSGNTC